MKRKELEVGLIVEAENGTELLVMDTKPWKNYGHWRPDLRPCQGGNGVAVMAKELNFKDEVMWRPRIAQLGKLFPKGTHAIYLEGLRAQRAREDLRRQKREEKESHLCKQLCIRNSYELTIRGDRVTLPLEKLEELLEKAGV